MEVSRITFLDLSQEAAQEKVEEVLKELGFEFADVFMFLEGDAVAVERADGRKEYMGLYNTHRNYASFTKWKSRQELILNGEKIY